ncbi:PAX-interacting protein 1 [Senna tora]|uniref:PAX-interacting protein 1 n=1 Tax=Senna tora TaxID=362788 RepID=A0A834TDJ0_9FABA|nr:PAX-interacting protein 1 [Senna tora]
MAPRTKPSSPIPIGNCEITVEAKNFTSKSDANSLYISLPRSGKIKVSVVKDVATNNINESDNFKTDDRVYIANDFVLVNPKDADGISKSYLQEVLQIYMTELPGMNYAANTGKKSNFLERCVNNGKYRTLLLKSGSVGNSGKVIAAITYQIVPADTEYAEIPLAAVSAIYQRKGLGQLLFLELRKRLQNVGIRSILCWGDKESEGFWLKQGFISIAEVDSKGRARRLPIKADIRKALCFPGGSTLMVCHLRMEFSTDAANSIKCLPSQLHQNSLKSADAENDQHKFTGQLHMDLNISNKSTCRTDNAENGHLDALVTNGFSREYDNWSGLTVNSFAQADGNTLVNGARLSNNGIDAEMEDCSNSTKGAKRTWEASLSSLKSKRVKGSHLVDRGSDSSRGFVSEADRSNSGFMGCSWGALRGKISVDLPCGDTLIVSENNSEKFTADYLHSEAFLSNKPPSTKQYFRIMLMNIADEAKKAHLTKVIEDLGGTVTSDGSMTTHVITGQVRKTLNFCTALCSGAWVVSSDWLKESFREGQFVDELPYILNDQDYLLKYRSDLKSAVLRAKACPGALFKGYNLCIAAHVQPPAKTLSAIVRSAGGNVIGELQKVNEASTTIFVTCEEDMEEAMIAAKKGMRTFSSEWFMNCVMRQELDMEASQFAESL